MVPAPTDVALNPATIPLNFIFIRQCADRTSLHFFIQLLFGVLLSPFSFSGSLGRDRIWLTLVSSFAVPHQSPVLRQLVRGWKLQPTFSFRRRLTIRDIQPADVISWSLLFWRTSMEKGLVPLHHQKELQFPHFPTLPVGMPSSPSGRSVGGFSHISRNVQ